MTTPTSKLMGHECRFIEAPIIDVLAEQRISHDGLGTILDWLQSRDPRCLPEKRDYATHPTRMSLLLPGMRPGAGGLPADTCSDNEHLAELAGRLCYRSFGDAAGRRSNDEYLEHIFSMDPLHASIAYHAKMTFFFAGVSRKFSHQFIRNYVGSDRTEEGSPSQESTRFCEHTGYYVIPPYALDAGAESLEAFKAAARTNWVSYQSLLRTEWDRFTRANGAEPKGMDRKRILEACSSALSQDSETSFVWTTNPIALRKFLHERCHPAADREIARFAEKLKALCLLRWPAFFSNMPEAR